MCKVLTFNSGDMELCVYHHLEWTPDHFTRITQSLLLSIFCGPSHPAIVLHSTVHQSDWVVQLSDHLHIIQILEEQLKE